MTDAEWAKIIAWMRKQKPPQPGYRMNLIIPLSGPIRFEWRKVIS